MAEFKVGDRVVSSVPLADDPPGIPTEIVSLVMSYNSHDAIVKAPNRGWVDAKFGREKYWFVPVSKLTHYRETVPVTDTAPEATPETLPAANTLPTEVETAAVRWIEDELNKFRVQPDVATTLSRLLHDVFNIDAQFVPARVKLVPLGSDSLQPVSK